MIQMEYDFHIDWGNEAEYSSDQPAAQGLVNPPRMDLPYWHGRISDGQLNLHKRSLF